jgi:hypothetical protein
MKLHNPKRQNSIPKDAVLLIPEPDGKDDPTCGVKPGYYNPKQMLKLIKKHMNDADAIQFIADMLETGDSENDGFAEILREDHNNPSVLAKTIKYCEIWPVF